MVLGNRKMLSAPDRPVIESLLDVDFYKFTMGQMIFHRHPTAPVKFAFRNRSRAVRLAEHLDLAELRANLDHLRHLRFSAAELHYLGGTFQYGRRMFHEDYIRYLRGFQLCEYQLDARDGQLLLEFAGAWPEASLWETLALAVASQLYMQSQTRGMTRLQRDLVADEGHRRLAEKIRALRQHPEVTFSDFGTRRRASRAWQDYIVGVLAEELPAEQFRGTSNTALAMKYGLTAMGTNAHELPMVYSGIYHAEDERDPLVSQRRVLADWEAEYGLGLSIFLADTYGSDWFFRHAVTPQQWRDWKGSRHDSGDPFDYGEKRIAEYHAAGVDPRAKLIVFADSLDVPLMVRLAGHFRGRIGITFGLGTNLTNDAGLSAISMVAKPVQACGHAVVKLSDNIEKATGDPAAIARMKRLVSYAVDYAAECRY
jgi:nicotinate phosphoribosyltransferase